LTITEAGNDLKKVCQTYFGKPRQDGSSHAIFKPDEQE